MITGFLKVDKGKVKRFVGNDVLLQLVNNEDGFSGTSTKHKAELHPIDDHHLVDVEI